MIRLYDTYAREKRVFEPADPRRITVYVCGPTVYNRAHIGNARPAVVFDVLARLLRHTYGEDSLVYAANVTDVEDKIMAAAAAEKVPIEVITERYGRFYFDDLGALGVRRPDVVPFATGHIPEMIAMIERLIAAGHAYAAESHVLFDVPSWPGYGRLSKRPMDEMIAGARVEIAPYKRSPADFVLWKPSSAGQPGWDSPWGRGRPGWHIECSAMIEAHLGETIDIHGGGLDLEFPHHENEIAQSSCAHGGAPLARYWLHNGMLSMAASKMSKSLGNVVTVGELLDDGHRGETLRLALLSAQYRQPLEWSPQLVAQSKATLDRLYRSILPSAAKRGDGDPESVAAALGDDLNTPLALSRLAELAKLGDVEATTRAGTLLGLLQQDPVDWFQGSGAPASDRVDPRLREESGRFGLGAEEIRLCIDRRAEAKKARDFGEADRIRADLAAQGILLEDGPQGTTWRRA
ncbi:MAG TPA: cysteine--tRNA ligase [Allosphingosinicella sp.]|nr:cysteine--tRNA ligase [Allosphingosinicella sp.]